jgi:hypothetical protein
MMPILGAASVETLDPMRLITYPVNRRTLAAASIVSAMLDLPSIIPAPILITLVIVCSPNPICGLIDSALVFLLVLHTATVSRAIQWIALAALRSRKARDITVFLLPLVGVLIFYVQQTVIWSMDRHSANMMTTVGDSVWKWAQYLPSGWAATGFSNAAFGLNGLALCSVAALAALGVASYWLLLCLLSIMERGEWLVNSDVKTEKGTKDTVQSGRKSRSRAARHADGIIGLRSLSPQLAAGIVKETLLFWRDPQYRSLIASMIYISVSFAIPAVLIRQEPEMQRMVFFGAGLPYVGAYAVCQTFAAVFSNSLGYDHAAIGRLLAFPSTGRLLLLAKNVVFGTVAFACAALLTTAYSLLVHAPQMIGLVCTMTLLILPIMIGLGNVMSVMSPYQPLQRGAVWGRGDRVRLGSASAGRGCGWGLLFLGYMLVVALASVPAIAAVLIPHYLVPAVWCLLSLPLGAAYSGGIYLLMLNLSSNLLRQRDREIIATLSAR